MFQHILVPLDGSGPSRLALGKAAALARLTGARVTVVAVVDTHLFPHGGGELTEHETEFIQSAVANAGQMLEDAQAELRAQGVACERSLLQGHVVHEGILHAARECGADLIAMGSHGRHGLEKLLLGSTAQRVLAHATVPVLAVRGDGE